MLPTKNWITYNQKKGQCSMPTGYEEYLCFTKLLSSCSAVMHVKKSHEFAEIFCSAIVHGVSFC